MAGTVNEGLNWDFSDFWPQRTMVALFAGRGTYNQSGGFDTESRPEGRRSTRASTGDNVSPKWEQRHEAGKEHQRIQASQAPAWGLSPMRMERFGCQGE